MSSTKSYPNCKAADREHYTFYTAQRNRQDAQGRAMPAAALFFEIVAQGLCGIQHMVFC